MQSPRPLRESKHVHWLSRPSEEQLLGPLPHQLREVNVSFEPPRAPDWGLSDTQVPDGKGAGTRRWRLGPRDLAALAAVAAVVWLAVRSGDGLPFRSSEPAAPAAAGNVVRTALAPDRADWTRTTPSTDATDAKGPDSKSDGGQKDKNDSSGPGGKDDDPPAGGGGSGGGGGGGGGGGEQPKPLVEATIPGVGTVTVDEPELPTLPDVDAPSLPALPDTGDLLPETPTLPLP
jgi:hypothetical protein